MRLYFSDFNIDRRDWVIQTPGYKYYWTIFETEELGPSLVHKCNDDVPLFHLPNKDFICHNCEVPIPKKVLALVRLTYLQDPEVFERVEWCHGCARTKS